jgi:V-type H+-transporting ATPase subunit F
MTCIFPHLCSLTLPQAAELIRDLVNDYRAAIPTLLEIPSKQQAYDESKDSVMQRVLRLLGRD